MSAGNTLVPGAICFDWTALFGVLCWELLSLLELKAPVTLVVWESLGLRNLVQSCPLSLRHICMKHPADEYCCTDLSEGCLDAGC